MERLFTIGAYGWDEAGFFGALKQAGADLFLDLRRRRGVRGPLYTFANAARLQAGLEASGIPYRHLIELAPDQDIRHLQERTDAATRTPRRQRVALGDSFIQEYTRRVLDPFDWAALTDYLQAFERPVLFCVERTPEACHRSLVAARLAHMAGVPETDLVP